MTKWQLDREGGPWDYPTLGFSATDGAIIDGSLSNPVMTTAPDAFWTVYVGGSAETGVTRWGEMVHPPAPAEPTEGSMLLYDAVDNRWAPTTAADVVADPEFGAALSTAITAEVAPVQALAEGTALQVAPAPGRKIAFAGDSHTAGTGVSESNRRFSVTAVMLAGTRYLARNPVQAGVGGNTSAQLLARFEADALADAAVSHVHVQIGTNDAGGGVTAATFAANIQSMHELTRLSGRSMSIGLVPPRSSSAGTATTRRLEAAYNDWLRSWAGPAGVILVDTRTPLIDPATGYLDAAADSDGVHFNNEGHLRLARAIADALRTAIPDQPGSPVVAPDVNVQTNGVMAGGGPSTVPTGWFKHPATATGTAPVIGTVADTSDTLTEGVWLQADITAAADSFFQILSPGIAETTHWADNDLMVMEAQLQVEDVAGFRAAANAGTASVLLQAATGVTRLGGQEAVNWTADEPLGPVRLPFTGPTSGTSINALLKVTVPNGVSVKVRLGEVVVRNLTREGAITLPT